MFNYIKFDFFLMSSLEKNVGGGEVKTVDTKTKLETSNESADKVQKLREELKTLDDIIKRVVGRRIDILEQKLSAQGNPKDPEYEQVLSTIKRLKAEIPTLTKDADGVRSELNQLLGNAEKEIRKISPDEMKKLKTIDNSKFLEIPMEKRLQYITKNGVDSSEISNGSVKDVEFTFTFDGQFNKELYLKTTAGQVLPKEVGEVKIGNEIYTRNNVGGEFFTPDNKRLTIHEGTKIEIGTLRTPEDLKNIQDKNIQAVNKYLKDNPEANKNIVSEAINRGIDPKFACLTFTDLVKDLQPDQAKLVLEDAFTEFDRIRGNVEASVTELQDLKYDENLAIGVFQKFSPDNWKEKAIAYGFTEEKVENYIKISNTKIDFSSIENGDMKAMIEKTAENLGVTPKIIQSILKQESNGNMSATRFEKHVYDRELRKGNTSDDARLLATSFGGFQIMGFNYKVCGYENVSSFVEAMKTPENQFNAFANFIKSNSSLHNAMKGDNPNFSKIAYYYNGPMYAQNNYDNKIKQHFYA